MTRDDFVYDNVFYHLEPLAKFVERGEFSLCSRGGAAGAQAGAGLSCVTRSI